MSVSSLVNPSPIDILSIRFSRYLPMSTACSSSPLSSPITWNSYTIGNVRTSTTAEDANRIEKALGKKVCFTVLWIAHDRRILDASKNEVESRIIVKYWKSVVESGGEECRVCADGDLDELTWFEQVYMTTECAWSSFAIFGDIPTYLGG
jgi:hypothetical protein